MKRAKSLLCLLLLLLLTVSACAAPSGGASSARTPAPSPSAGPAAEPTPEPVSETYTFTDGRSKEVTVDRNPQRVVCTYGSYCPTSAAGLWSTARISIPPILLCPRNWRRSPSWPTARPSAPRWCWRPSPTWSS